MTTCMTVAGPHWSQPIGTVFAPGAWPHIMPAIVVQVLVGVAATIPFARRPSVNTTLMALTLWLAGAVTVAGQPIIEPRGVVVGALSGSAQALLLDDLLVVAWALSGSFLYMNYLYPERTPRQRLLRRGLLLGHLLILLALLTLARPASADPQIVDEGVWFPVRAEMLPAALAYGLIGKTYILGMQVWACIGCWQAMRRLPFSAMRAAIAFGFCVASAVLVQGLAVTIAQARGQQFFAPPDGPRLDALWLGLGLLCPLAAFSVAGALRRWQLLFLRRDLLALRQRLLDSQAPESGRSNGRGNALATWVRSLAHPVADVDQLSVEIRDLLAARYPMPTEATALAGVWLWRQPPESATQLNERDIALLLLGATILGVEQRIVTPIPLDFPQPVLQRFAEDTDWNIPADALFLRTVERLLEGRPAPSAHALVSEGLRDVNAHLRAAQMTGGAASAERRADGAIPTLIEAWLGEIERAQSGESGAERDEKVTDCKPLAWWQPPARGVG